MTTDHVEEYGPYVAAVPPDLRQRHCDPTVPLSQIEAEFRQLCESTERDDLARELEQAERQQRAHERRVLAKRRKRGTL